MYRIKQMKSGMAGAAIAASMLLWAPIAGAATIDGTVGPTSTGTVDVQIFVPNLVQVMNLDVIDLIYAPGAGDVTAVEPFCVWATPGTAYDLRISSLSPSASTVFTAASAASDTVTYSVDFSEDGSLDNWVPVTEAATLGGPFTASDSVSPGCAIDNAAIRVTAVEAGNLGVAPAGFYVDELTLLVTAL